MKLVNELKLSLLLCLITFTFSFNTATETEEKLKSEINISEGNMKHRKSLLKLKQTLPINDVVSKDSDIGKTSNVLNIATNSNESPKSNAKEEGPVFYTAWMKYFKYAESSPNETTPKEFFKNNQFYEQSKVFPTADLSKTSSDGVSTLNSFITTPLQFYVVLFKNSINFVSSRQTQLQKTYDVLNVDTLREVTEDRGYGVSTQKTSRDAANAEKIEDNLNGIQDFGNFSEGFCFKLLALKPIQTWVLCAESLAIKNKFMESLKKLKIQKQRDQGIVAVSRDRKNEKKSDSISGILNTGSSATMEEEEGNLKVTENNPKDGYWVTIQEWTQCSLKCGGGTSTLQRMCVPPKHGGKDCDGKSIITKPCNTQPCPGISVSGHVANNNTITLKPVVKVLPFSSRPQRFTKCIIKESDLMYTQENNNDNNGNNNPLVRANNKEVPSIQIPVRVVMNNRTVSLFSGDEYNSLIMGFSLENTKFRASIIHKNCFKFQEGHKIAELCPFGVDYTGKTSDEWEVDFDLFKNKCFEPRDKVLLNKELDSEMKKKLEQKIKQAKIDILQERETEVKNGVQKQEENEIESAIKTTNNVALQAIQKELNLEAMIRQEESEREKREEKELMLKIEEEKKKKECLVKAIQERQLENSYTIKAKEAEDEITSIKKAAADQVIIRRSQLKNQILQMRKKAEKRKATLAQKLQTVRISMADTMGKVYKKGDQNKCKLASDNPHVRQAYCDANFMDNYNNMNSCKEGDDFCVTCCDNEFGEMFVNERQACYKHVCTPNPADSDSGDAKGRWIWQNQLTR